MSVTEDRKKTSDVQAPVEESTDQITDVIEDTPKDPIESSSSNANGNPAGGKKEKKSEPVDEVLSIESQNTQPKLVIDEGSTVATEATGEANSQETNEPEVLVDEVSVSQEVVSSQATVKEDFDVSNLELVDDSMDETVVNVEESNKDQMKKVEPIASQIKQEAPLITLDNDETKKEDNGQKTEAEQKETVVAANTEKPVNDSVVDPNQNKVAGFTSIDSFGIPLQQDHLDKFDLNTEVVILNKKHFDTFFTHNPKRPHQVLLNAERLRSFVAKMDAPSSKKFIYKAKLKSWMRGILTLEPDQKVLPLNTPGPQLLGYTKDETAKTIKETVQIQRMEKARQLMEKVGTTETDPSQIQAPVVNEKIMKILEKRAVPQQKKLLANERKRNRRNQNRQQNALSKAMGESGVPAFSPIVDPPLTTTQSPEKESDTGVVQQKPTAPPSAAAVQKATQPAAKPTQSKPNQNQQQPARTIANVKKNEEKRTFPEKQKHGRPQSAFTHSNGFSQKQKPRGPDENAQKKLARDNRKPEPFNRKRPRNGPIDNPRRGGNIFPAEKRIRVWDAQGPRSFSNNEPSPFARSLFQDPYRPIDGMPIGYGNDPYSNQQRSYSDFATMAQPSAAFAVPQSGFPVYSEQQQQQHSSFGGSSQRDTYGYSSFGASTSNHHQPAYGMEQERGSLTEIRRIERELETLRQNQHVPMGGAPSVSSPKNPSMFGSGSGFSGSSGYGFSGSSDTKKRFSNYGY